MRVYSSSVAAVLAAVVLGQTVGAQQSWSPFVAFSSAPSGGPLAASPTSPMVVEPGAYFESARGSMLARWSATFNQRSPRVGDADLASRVRLGTMRGLESSIYTVGHYDRGGVGTTASANAAFRMQIGSASPSHGFQVGVGADSWRSNGDNELVPATTASAWVRQFGLSFSAEVSARAMPATRTVGDSSGTRVIDHYTAEQRWDSLADSAVMVSVPHFRDDPGGSSSFTPARTFGETRLRVSGTLMSLGVDGQLGRTIATKGASRTFGSMILTRWLSQSVAITGGMVFQPPEPGGSAGRSGGLLGIRLATGPHGVPSVVNAPKTGALSTTVRTADGQTIIEVNAAGAGHVEVSGDFTHWLPVALERGRGDRWTLKTTMTPGIHRLIIRVDGGAWLAPPGLPQTADPYEGNVGVIVTA